MPSTMALSSQKLWFCLRLIYIGFAVGKLAQGKALLWALCFFPGNYHSTGDQHSWPILCCTTKDFRLSSLLIQCINNPVIWYNNSTDDSHLLGYYIMSTGKYSSCYKRSLGLHGPQHVGSKLLQKNCDYLPSTRHNIKNLNLHPHHCETQNLTQW